MAVYKIEISLDTGKSLLSKKEIDQLEERIENMMFDSIEDDDLPSVDIDDVGWDINIRKVRARKPRSTYYSSAGWQLPTNI